MNSASTGVGIATTNGAERVGLAMVHLAGPSGGTVWKGTTGHQALCDGAGPSVACHGGSTDEVVKNTVPGSSSATISPELPGISDSVTGSAP